MAKQIAREEEPLSGVRLPALELFYGARGWAFVLADDNCLAQNNSHSSSVGIAFQIIPYQ